jgi:hypothetical protein
MGDLPDVPASPPGHHLTMPDGVSGAELRRKEESHTMSRLIAFRRFRADHRHGEPATSTVAPTDQPTTPPSPLPQYTDVAEAVLNRTERAFGRRPDGTLLERFALEAVIDALSNPSPALSATQPAIRPRGPRAHHESNAA